MIVNWLQKRVNAHKQRRLVKLTGELGYLNEYIHAAESDEDYFGSELDHLYRKRQNIAWRRAELIHELGAY